MDPGANGMKSHGEGDYYRIRQGNEDENLSEN
jgi:hypothetical protein